MNEEALQYAYDLFKADGYSDSIDDFKNLLSTNTEALDYSYKLFRDDGYNDSPNDFKNLLGIQDPLKKKKFLGNQKRWMVLWSRKTCSTQPKSLMRV